MLRPDYTKLATYYDFLQQDIDYNIWMQFLENNIKKLKKNNEKIKILEVGCGTGKFAEMLNMEQFEYTGFDLSPEMIEIAKTKNIKGKFLVEDVCEFQLFEKFDVIICFMDTINYLTTNDQVVQAMKNMAKHLHTNGMLLFDIHQQDNLENFDDYQEIGYIDEVQYIWHSKQIDEIRVNHFLTFIDLEGQIDECHEQMIAARAYYEQIVEKYFTIKSITRDDYREYFVVCKGE